MCVRARERERERKREREGEREKKVDRERGLMDGRVERRRGKIKGGRVI